MILTIAATGAVIAFAVVTDVMTAVLRELGDRSQVIFQCKRKRSAYLQLRRARVPLPAQFVVVVKAAHADGLRPVSGPRLEGGLLRCC